MDAHKPNELTAYVNRLFIDNKLSFLQPDTRLVLELADHGRLYCYLGRSEITLSVIYVLPHGDTEKPELEICCLQDGCGDWRPTTVIHNPSGNYEWGDIWWPQSIHFIDDPHMLAVVLDSCNAWTAQLRTQG